MHYEEDQEDFILRRRREFMAKQRALREKIDEDQPFDCARNDRFRLLAEEYRDVCDLGTVIDVLTKIKKSYDAA